MPIMHRRLTGPDPVNRGKMSLFLSVVVAARPVARAEAARLG